MNEFRYNLPYQELVGGAIAISKQHFIQVNGFSNNFFGWGGEDDEFYQRLAKHHLHPLRLPPHQSNYVSLKHLKQSPTYSFLSHTSHTEDGLDTLEYQILSIKYLPMYTLVKVSL